MGNGDDGALFIKRRQARVVRVNLHRLQKSAWIIRICTLHRFRSMARTLIGWGDGILPTRWMQLGLIGAILAVPPGLRGRRYQAAHVHLRLFKYSVGDADHQARRHLALRLLCEGRQRGPVAKDPVRWRDRIRATTWHDPSASWRLPRPGMHMIALLRTGDPLIALARIIEQCPPSARFFIALPCFHEDPLHRMVRSLRQFGYGIETADRRDPMLSVTMVRRMMQGVTVLAFVDLPALGQPASHLCNASLSAETGDGQEHDPIGLAHLAGTDILVAGHRMDAGPGDGLHVVQRVPHGPFSRMSHAVLQHAAAFIAHDPANWHHLDRAAPIFSRRAAEG